MKNARVAGWGVLTCGRNEERVALVELPPEERAPVLRAFPREVPHGVEFFVRLGIADSPDPEASRRPHRGAPSSTSRASAAASLRDDFVTATYGLPG
ncbi:MAG TPA: hypothetical protein VE712_04085, partial [Actinomycetota bacterium]|nr:hypothetical protein [Actinomycetota bacterium]